ncbi:hypothetical protein HMPREF0083_04798 [Aneurinibacillus aneurinilyticus ATCC 12856]|uniref:Uncharacterized protein n=1 Tax=Aneurinibacillus aneurinilyticus ATCC 12856 TaxID=649747 RepID=U1WWU4_ANEAE|nr:hypothetical protein HMPREF0083_04798 [Aneurinibacillus aneurinilyticus ATCC 12856]
MNPVTSKVPVSDVEDKQIKDKTLVKGNGANHTNSFHRQKLIFLYFSQI